MKCSPLDSFSEQSPRGIGVYENYLFYISDDGNKRLNIYNNDLLQKSRLLAFYWSDKQFNCVMGYHLQKFEIKRVFLQMAQLI
ncbi:MAG: hypothetical protein A2015_00750 [Spirochaetes bacterium GWF1_31_7]|nr:MAG: hypothetical protein A2Y30_12615 [Spirochaetes bacterium GWE1_32_154]OHD51651.1 MAG: hypothetical protein A2Y29_04415 [Spirochaetes bacterium GWE2_31_10]OHD51904.1 MAG: hypothetical protein A2015_00750 [Spirochaetes bacterium GWF1_31_7]OHD81014.1 MAG: hypothetical protein A2355_08690 [Spirochaetes bacterium RIFOXYB1_FULL_32_8]